ncbi:hypothetical protein ABID97_003652 [Variovorax sp. OAS795]|uniref:hypothetical protein n=1 Tax=Variovorax sp. OAS795 TaxID=3034231 RepID=UPI00339A0FC0
MIAIHNTATGKDFATYGDLKERAEADCKYMNETELKFGRPAIYAVIDLSAKRASSVPEPS